MDTIILKITEWLKTLLIKGITDQLTGMFDTVNIKVGEIAAQVETTPSAWNGGVFSMIHSLSETVIVPIASVSRFFVRTNLKYNAAFHSKSRYSIDNRR
jgi:hypothetical protein